MLPPRALYSSKIFNTTEAQSQFYLESPEAITCFPSPSAHRMPTTGWEKSSRSWQWVIYRCLYPCSDISQLPGLCWSKYDLLSFALFKTQGQQPSCDLPVTLSARHPCIRNSHQRFMAPLSVLLACLAHGARGRKAVTTWL